MLRLSLGVFLSAEELLSQGRCVPGDLLEIDRKLYAHWVVYVGNGEVVHLPETDIEKAVVAKSSLEAVAQGCHVRVNNKVVPAKERRLEALPDEQVVVRAMKSVGDIVTYNIVVSNCEHFATQLKYGVGWSDQYLISEQQAKALQHSMTCLSPTSTQPVQVDKAHSDIWGRINTILSNSPPQSPTS